ncbi:MAG: SDR family oxidoreductase [Gammaproteobacteria bacterium]|nr:SDR family oxidoreductase [Gammaproteobacteria bacterium]
MSEAEQTVITGASRGIGAAIASTLAAAGHTVVGLSRSGESAAGTGIRCDVTDEAAVGAALAGIAERGPIRALVNNAGVHLTSPAAKLSTQRYEQVMQLNATAVMVLCREAYPYLKAHGAGRIINIGSFFDKLGVPDNVAYCASKAAVAAITRCLAVEWAVDGIAVVNLAPGYVETDLNRDYLSRPKVQDFLRGRIPGGRVGTVDEVARLVKAVLDADVGYLTGETIYMDGGHGMNH